MDARDVTIMTDMATESKGHDALASRLADRTQKPRRAPADCGDLGIRIGRDGTWHYRNSPIGRLPLVKLFASVLRRDEAGLYWLVTPAERGFIHVEDAPFLAVELDVRGEGAARELVFRTNLDDIVAADADHPLRVAYEGNEPRPYLLVRNGLEARLTRSVFYQLVEHGREEEWGGRRMFGVWSRNHFFPLAQSDGAP
jgi:uncharacterized protein